MAPNIFLDLPNGMKIPALGLGTFTEKEPGELETALKAALDLGYRHIDTAALYHNEHVIGKVLKEAISSGKVKRDELFITTKLPPTGNQPDLVEGFLNESLKKLQLDYVDLYLIHFPTGMKPKTDPTSTDFELLPKTDHVGIWKSMEKQVKAGRAKSIGLSNFNISQMQNVLKNAEIKPANLQVEVQLYMQQEELLELCKKNGISVVAYGPLGNPAYKKALSDQGVGTVDLPNVREHPLVKEIGQKHSKTPAQVLLRFLLQLGVAPIPRSVNPKRLKENFDVFDYQLDADDMKKLKSVNVGEKARLYTMETIKGIKDHPDYPFSKD